MIASYTPKPQRAPQITRANVGVNSTPTRPQIQTITRPSAPALEYITADAAQIAALDLYNRGLNVFPMVRGTKDGHFTAWKRLQTTRLADPGRNLITRETFLILFTGANVAVLTGRTSLNLAVLDCETMEIAELHRAEFERRQLHPWIVRTSRGMHFYFLSAAGTLANQPDDKAKPRGWELRADGIYVMAPPSVHPSGAVYEWIERTDELPPLVPLAALDWIGAQLAVKQRAKFVPRPDTPTNDALACLAKTTRDFCENGAPKEIRNKRLFRAASDFAGNQIEIETARPYLLQGAERSTFDPSFTRTQVARTIASAYSKPRTASRAFYGPVYKRAPLAIWKRAQQFAEAHDWQALTTERNRRKITVSAQTARAVFEACTERARMDDTRRACDSFRAAVREIAEIANVERGTAYKALRCLTGAQYLKWHDVTDTGANRFTFGEKMRNAPKRDSTSTTIFTTVAFWRVSAFADVFRRGALSRTAGRVWLVILEHPLPPAQIAARANVRNVGTVRKALAKLAAHNLARRVDRCWIGEQADAARLEHIAETCGTQSKAAQRHQRHQGERAESVTEAYRRAREKRARRELYAALKRGAA